MKIIPLFNLCSTDFYLRSINGIYRTPAYTTLKSSQSEQNGVCNGFLLIDKGCCRYQWKDHDVSLTRGALLYLPGSCRRTMIITEKPFSFWRINFRLFEAASDEEIVFCEDPWVITENASQSFYDLGEKLARSTLSQTTQLGSMALLFDYFEQIRRIGQHENHGRIAAAVEYIDSHYIEDIDVRALAELCYISEPHLFRLFRRELGKTPVDYRNSLRIDRAKSLLRDDECSIGEIASMVGFENIYYFSRVFRQYAGISPSEFRSQIGAKI